MGLDRLDSNITNRDVVLQEQNPVKKQDTTSKTVPIVTENKQENSDLDKPIKGYTIEKTTKKPDENPDDNNEDDINTGVDPNARISILPSIAINKNTEEITSSMDQAVNRIVAGICNNASEDSYYKAQTMLSESNPYKCFDEINFAKSFNIYGKAVYEGNYLNYTNNEPSSEITLTRHSERANLGLNGRSKSGNTKAFAFGSFTHTNSKFKLESSEPDTASDEEPFDTENNMSYNSYSFLGAIQHKFKNGDIVTGSGFHINDASQEIATTSIDASYFLRKFMVLAEGKTTIYKAGILKPVTKTDFSISLNPELAIEPPKKEENNLDENAQNAEKNNVELNTSAKKWSTVLSPFFETQSIQSSTSGNTEEGIGLKVRLKRTDDNSNFRLATFGKVSTTQQEGNNRYHVTFGSGIKYTKNIGKKSLLKAEAEVKDRYTFGHENILTASANAMFTSHNFSAEAEAKRILISGDQPSYFGIVGRAYYTPKKNINLYTEVSNTNLKEINSELKGTNIQAGVIVNF